MTDPGQIRRDAEFAQMLQEEEFRAASGFDRMSAIFGRSPSATGLSSATSAGAYGAEAEDPASRRARTRYDQRRYPSDEDPSSRRYRRESRYNSDARRYSGSSHGEPGRRRSGSGSAAPETRPREEFGFSFAVGGPNRSFHHEFRRTTRTSSSDDDMSPAARAAAAAQARHPQYDRRRPESEFGPPFGEPGNMDGFGRPGRSDSAFDNYFGEPNNDFAGRMEDLFGQIFGRQMGFPDPGLMRTDSHGMHGGETRGTNHEDPYGRRGSGSDERMDQPDRDPTPGFPNNDVFDMFESVLGRFSAMNRGAAPGMAPGERRQGSPGNTPEHMPPFAQLLASFGIFGNQGGMESYEELLRMSENVGTENRGATQEEVERLPTMRYSAACANRGVRPGRAGASSASRQDPGSKSEEADKCPICLDEFEDDTEVKRLPCSHLFCAPCVSQWLQVNKECPCCKASIRPEPGHSSG